MTSPHNRVSARYPVEKTRCSAPLVFLLMNLVVYPFLVLWTAAGMVLAPIGYVFWRFVLGWQTDRIVRLFIWIYGRVWMLGILPFVRFRRHNCRKALFNNPCIIVVNHLSFFDTYFMAALPVSNIAFAVAAWPFKMLWFKPFMQTAKYLNVESWSWEQIVAHARQILARRGSILFYPEGHRSRDGKLQRFYSGAFRLAIETGVPVLPLCITGTDILLPPGRKLFCPARVTLQALDLVYPQDFCGPSGHVEMRKLIKIRIRKTLQDIQKAQGGEA